MCQDPFNSNFVLSHNCISSHSFMLSLNLRKYGGVFAIWSITHVPSSMEPKKDPIKSHFLYISIFHFHITMITTGAAPVLYPLYCIFIWTMFPLLAYWNTMLVSKASLRKKCNMSWFISYPYPVFLPQKEIKLTICFGQIQFSWQ